MVQMMVWGNNEKIKIITPKISLINIIGILPSSPRKYTLPTTDSGTNIHLSNEYTPTMTPVIISKK